MIIYVMGVSGSGKSTIGHLLSEQLGIPFADGDDFHPKENVEKMRQGHALDDTDRQGWLEAIQQFALQAQTKQGAIIACSALKEKYRALLSKDIEKVYWVYLKGSFEQISQRLQRRSDHFMPASLLQSQFDTLEVPNKAIIVDIDQAPGEMIHKILLEIAS